MAPRSSRTAPPSAVSVWMEGFSLNVLFRDKSGDHTVMLPLNKFQQDGTNVGYEVFLNILRERAKGSGPIATKFQPTQHQVERAVRDFNKKRPAERKRPGTAEQRAAAADVVARLIGTKQ